MNKEKVTDKKYRRESVKAMRAKFLNTQSTPEKSRMAIKLLSDLFQYSINMVEKDNLTDGNESNKNGTGSSY